MKSILKIKQALLILSACFCFSCAAQNLAPNSSFEILDSCPSFYGEIDKAAGWNGYGSAELFAYCSTFPQISVPSNVMGYQNASTGTNYAGLIAFEKGSPNSNFREFIYTILFDTLEAGKSYCTNIRVSLCDSCLYAIRTVGIYVNDSLINPILGTSPFLKNITPQIEGNVTLVDKSVWISISGIINSDGGERYITIGNFSRDIDSDTMYVTGAVTQQQNWQTAYYYIDDISIEELTPVAAGPDQNIAIGDSIQIGLNLDSAATYVWQPHIGITDTTAINPWVHPTQTTAYTVIKTQCSVTTTDTVVVYVSPVGMEQYNLQSHFKLYPNPNAGEFTVEQNQELPANLQVYALSGKLVGKFNLKGQSSTIKLSNLENGIYFYTITTGDKVLKRDKIVIIH